MKEVKIKKTRKRRQKSADEKEKEPRALNFILLQKRKKQYVNFKKQMIEELEKNFTSKKYSLLLKS